MNRSGERLVLLTGATGYVGGRLLPELERRGERVRCLARRPGHLRNRVGPGTEVVEGDVLRPDTLEPAFEGVDVAYYLIHSMGSSGDFEERDRRAAENFAEAARRAGASRLVYLGGLGESGDLSRHLESRQEVGRILRESGVPTAEFQAAIVIGSGSLSFEMIRSLVERLPVMVTPRWVRTRTQPIAVEDLVSYLAGALDVELPESTVFEIGGTDRVSYGGVMREYARQRGLRRLMVPVPLLSPRLSSLWLGLVTPLYARVGRKLVTSLQNETVVTDDRALRFFDVRPMGIAKAIRRAREMEDAELARTRWSDALSSAGAGDADGEAGWGGRRFGSRIVDSRTVDVASAPAEAFRPVRRIGGQTGWYWGDGLWKLRGFLDLLVGGVGSRRGRRDPERLHPGDTVDFWRVEEVEEDRRLRLRAEMKLPGRAWLEFEVEALSETTGGDAGRGGPGARIRQTAIFDPLGLAGLAYWYLLYPIHALVFRGMLRGIARAAEEESDRRRGRP